MAAVSARFDALARFAVAAAVAIALLLLYNRIKVDAENAALGAENHAAVEVWRGRRITAPRPGEIADVVAEVRSTEFVAPSLRPEIVVWLGNSQLHTINQYRSGEHLAPYWLAEASACGGCVLPLGLSLPNANLQEHLVLALHAMRRLPVALVTLKLVFDDLREDGLRDELAVLLGDDVRAELALSSIGREMLAAWEQRTTKPGSGETRPQGLEGFAQRRLEGALDARLSSIIPLWAERGNLRGRVMLDLYHGRNALLGITPTSVRRMIPARYARNMRALDEIVAATRRADVPLLVYIAPIRSDVPLPYDVSAYRQWIAEIAAKAERDGVSFLSLESVVPNDRWGTYVADQVDFMHFQGDGHQRLATALWPEMQRLLGASRGLRTAGSGAGP